MVQKVLRASDAIGMLGIRVVVEIVSLEGGIIVVDVFTLATFFAHDN